MMSTEDEEEERDEATPNESDCVKQLIKVSQQKKSKKNYYNYSFVVCWLFV